MHVTMNNNDSEVYEHLLKLNSNATGIRYPWNFQRNFGD